RPTRRSRGGHRPAPPSGNTLASPMQGTIVKVGVVEGEQVNEGDQVAVLEAMKMEQPLVAHRSGVVRNLIAEPGATVASGEVICEIVDAD
ncbi:acetyl-/propionyl-CoA carboxylase subunit alpha, partial [Cutibacterium granulosum DSM 20700]